MMLRDWLQEYFAALIFAHVNLREDEMSKENLKDLQQALDAFFENSRLRSPDLAHNNAAETFTLCSVAWDQTQQKLSKVMDLPLAEF